MRVNIQIQNIHAQHLTGAPVYHPIADAHGAHIANLAGNRAVMRQNLKPLCGIILQLNGAAVGMDTLRHFIGGKTLYGNQRAVTGIFFNLNVIITGYRF